MNKSASEFVPYTQQYYGGGFGYNYNRNNRNYWNKNQNQKLVSIQTLIEQSDLIKKGIKSLYDDRIRPEMQTLKKRLEELDELKAFDGKIREEVLKFACEKLEFLVVKVENDVKGRERVIAHFCNAWDVPEGFRGFVDAMDSDASRYSTTLWQNIKEYICKLSATDDKYQYTFPGGRYGMARRLMDEGHPFLQTLVLGEVCHIVQLLLDMKIIAYGRQGHVVPFEKSVSALKATNAQLMQPTFVAPEGSAGPVEEKERSTRVIRDMDELVQVMESILYPEVDALHPRTLLLSNLKAEIRERFGLELSETSLGVTKLAELLKAPHLSDVCEVSWRKNNPVLLPHPSLGLKAPRHPLLPPRMQWLKMVNSVSLALPLPHHVKDDSVSHKGKGVSPTYALPPPSRISPINLKDKGTNRLTSMQKPYFCEDKKVAFNMLGDESEYGEVKEKMEGNESVGNMTVIPNTMDMTNYDYFPAYDTNPALYNLHSPSHPNINNFSPVPQVVVGTVSASTPDNMAIIRVAAEAAAELAACGVTDRAAIEVLVQSKLNHLTSQRVAYGAMTRSPTSSPVRHRDLVQTVHGGAMPKLLAEALNVGSSPMKSQKSSPSNLELNPPCARVQNTFLNFQADEKKKFVKFHSWSFPEPPCAFFGEEGPQ